MKYETLTKNVIDAVRNDINTVNKWQVAGASVREFYGTETALTEVKAQFIADAIIPALDKKHAAALAVELPRKGSKEYNALDAAGIEKWKVQYQAKKDARSTADTMFARVVKYAFPAEKVESETETKTTKTKIVNLINDAIGKAEKDTAPDYDAVVLIQQLRAALATASK